VKSTSWFSFGQVHTHSYNGQTLDKDTIVKVTAEDPRSVMAELFGAKWCWEYSEEPDMKWFPNGIVEIER
jgi:hypothetical protein